MDRHRPVHVKHENIIIYVPSIDAHTICIRIYNLPSKTQHILCFTVVTIVYIINYDICTCKSQLI